MKYTIECPIDTTVTVCLKGGMRIQFECDYEYCHSHQIDNAEVEAVILKRDTDLQVVLPSEPEFANYIVVTNQVRDDIQRMGNPTQYEVSPQFQNVEDEPENIDKLPSQAESSDSILSENFLRAQLSTKHQMIIRNAMAIVSALAVSLMYILEKLGIIN